MVSPAMVQADNGPWGQQANPAHGRCHGNVCPTALSGLALLGIDGPGTHAGLWHYGAGLAASVAVACHAARRMGTLIKASGSKRRP